MRYSNLLAYMFHAQATYEDHNVQEFSTLVSLGGDQDSYLVCILVARFQVPKNHL